MTEEEAKTKWCPFARSLIALREVESQNVAGGTSANRWNGISTNTPPVSDIPKCIGSACMAWRERKQWRWTDVNPPEWQDGHEPAHHLKENGLEFFCGLAGKP